MSKLPIMGSPWAWFCYFFIFSDFSSSFFWFFFFCLKVEQINFFFFNLMVFLIFDWGLGEWVRNGWGAQLCNVGGAIYFFFIV